MKLKWIVLVVLFGLLMACNLRSRPVGPAITVSPAADTAVAATLLPDLMTDNYDVHYFACPWGGPGEVRGWVKNIGDGNAGAFDVKINGGMTTLPGLQSGIGAWASVPFDSGPIGGVEINVDPDNKIQETDKSNNPYQIIFTPPPHCDTETPGVEVTSFVTPTLISLQTVVFKVAAGESWNTPEVDIRKGDTVQIIYKGGKWTYSPQVGLFDANGDTAKPTCGSIQPGARCPEPVPYAATGALIATYDNPAYFLVGNQTTFIASRDGFLNLKMNAARDDKTVQSRSGEIIVEITIRR